MPLPESSFEGRLEAVRNRIRAAAERVHRDPATITLVAVSKKFSAQRIREAYQAGVRLFGENYVQEFAAKRPALGHLDGARFHLIGHLQSNKARPACELFDVIETVDSPKLLKRLDAISGERRSTLEVLFEIKLSDEPDKSGAAPDTLPDLAAAAQDCRHLHVSGLMTVPPWSDDPEHSRPYFRRLAELARPYGWQTLSMGMSGDFEVAIEEGATVIRVGTALFGQRPKPAVAESA